MAAVILHSVSKSFDPGSAAVDSISVEISSGEFVTLLGPSGCGKTTTLRLIAGLIHPDKGQIEVGGRNVTTLPVYRRNIGMVFQSHALFPHMTIAENVAFGLKMRGIGRTERDRRVSDALAMVKLSDFAGRIPNQLSGGQQQRVALARALVVKPDVLLLDEPFGALDRKLREAMQAELRELTQKIGITSIFVTHDQEEALILSDRIAVMNAGRIEQIGTPDQIFDRPATRFVADFMAFTNMLDGFVLNSDHDGVLVQTGGLRISADRQDIAPGRRVAVAIRPERIRLTHLMNGNCGLGVGTVEARTYQGVACTYQVRLGEHDGPVIAVREPTPGDATFRFEVGVRVEVTWPKAAVRLLEI